MAQADAAHLQRRQQHLQYNYIVAQLDVVLNDELASCPFITLQTIKDKYAELFDGRDVQNDLQSLGFELFSVVEKHFGAFKAMRDPNLPGLLRRNAIDRPTQNSRISFADGDNGVQGSPLPPAIEAPVEVMPKDSDADVGGGIEAVPGTMSEFLTEHTPPLDESIILTEEREEQWGIDSMDRIPTLDDVGMPSARRVLPIVKPSPNNQPQPATRRSPASDRQGAEWTERGVPCCAEVWCRGGTCGNRSNATTLSPSARHKPHHLSDSAEGSSEPYEQRSQAGGGRINVNDYFDEGIGSPITARQTEVDVPRGARESRDLRMNRTVQAERVESEEVQEAPPVPAPEPHEQQKAVKKATEEKLKAMYAGRHYSMLGRQIDDADFACDNSNQSGQRPAPRFGSVFGSDTRHRTESATAAQNAVPKSPGFKMSSQHSSPPAERSRRAETAPPPPDFTSSYATPLPASPVRMPPSPVRNNQPAPLGSSNPVPVLAQNAQEVKVGAPLAGERSAVLPTAGRTAALESAVRSSVSTASLVEDEYSSSDFHTAQSGPLEESDSSQDVFGTANEDSEEEETRTLRPSGSSLTADISATPKASRSTTAIEESAGGLAICLEQFGLHDLLSELASVGHPGSQPVAASAASNGSAAETGADPALIARNLADDFFGSLERFTSAPTAAVCRNDAVDLECFATDFLEELPTDALPTQELHAQSSSAAENSPSRVAPPERHLYVMSDEWHIDNYEAASAERRRLCEESADFREPPPGPVRDWIDQVKDPWVLLDILLDLDGAYPEGFTPDELAEYEFGRACAERHGMYHWAATTNVLGLHRMLELRMIVVDAATRKLRVNKAVERVKMMALPNNFCSNFYRYLEYNGEMEVRQAMKSLKSIEPPPTRLSDRDLLHLINHFPRVFLLECKDKEHDFFKATVKLNPDLPKWRVVLDWEYPDYTLFMPIPLCPHPYCNGPW